MISMLCADLLKLRKRAIGWVMLAISLLLATLIMLLMAWQNGMAHTQLAGFPRGLLTGPTIVEESLGTFMAIILSAKLVGSEYQYDTWKILLTRYPGRSAFVLSKWMTLALALGFAMIVLAFWSQGLSWLLGAGSNLAQHQPLGVVLLELLVRTTILMTSGTVALFGVILFRSTFAGIATGITWLLVDAIASAVTVVPAGIKRCLFSPVEHNLLAYLHGQAGDSPLAWCLCLLGLYLVVPLGLAMYMFHQRDVTG